MDKPVLMTRNYLLAFTGNFLMFSAFYLLLPILPIYLVEQFAADKTVVGIVLSLYTLTALGVRPFAGFLVDFYQRKPLLLITYTLFVGMFAGYLLAGTLMMFTIMRSMHGFAFGLVTTSQATVAIDVMHPARRNEGIGYYGLSSNIAVAISPMFSMYLFDHFHNYDMIFLMALAAGVIGLVCVSQLKLKSRERVKNQPLSLDRFFLRNGVPGFITLLPVSFGYGVLSTYVAIYARQEAGIESGIGLFFFLLAVGMMLSRLVNARMMERGLLTQVVKIGFLLLIAGFTLFSFLHGVIAFYVSAFVLGMGYGFICPALQAMLVGMATNYQRGTANSTYFTSFDLGLGIGVMVGGKIASAVNYGATYTTSLVLIATAAIFFFAYTANHYEHHKLNNQSEN